MILSFLVFSLVVMKVGGFTTPYHATKKFSYGLEAERLCKAYRKVCPATKVCVIQHLVWPRKMSFPVCVREQKISLKSKVCELPPAPGRCGAKFRRWYFNVHAGKCSWFTFGGCDGNLNNFRNEDECEKVCLPKNASRPSVSSNAIISIPAPPRKPAVLHHPAPVAIRMRKDDLRQALELKKGKEERTGDMKKGLDETIDMKKGMDIDDMQRGIEGSTDEGKEEMEESLDATLIKPKKLRRKHRKGRKGRKGKKRGKGRKGRRRKGKGKKHNITGPYAELRVRKTSYRKEEAAQNDQGEENIRKNRKRLLRKLRRGRGDYYDNIKLFRILSTRDNPHGITLW